MSFESINSLKKVKVEGSDHESQESLSTNFEKYTEEGIHKALDIIRERFEGRDDTEENLPYHCSAHTEGVVLNTTKILEAVGASERDIALGRVIAAFHDTVQEYAFEETDDGKIMRKRAIGDNEAASLAELEEYLRAANEEVGMEVFTEEDILIGRRAIAGTEPDFNSDLGTVIQPKAEGETSKVARAVSLADLGAIGIDSEEFLSGGDNLFREEQIDILRAIESGEELTSEQKERYKERMVGWSESQAGFAKGRQKLFESETVVFSKEEQSVLLDTVFTQFDESVEAASVVAGKRKDMSFEEIAQDMGYVIKN